ncbi:hypothetical protein E2C01_027050 [Portunus trituberculatus]|uniref:Uncharacterized protein n=1 Tax=Portunus trituberculatus TaxID=210409 RepID=A0A5B7EH55_PORTR|nr:hypothetical protein [Portunus trituberculatus]
MRLGPIRCDRGAVDGQEVVRRMGLGTAVSDRCQNYTHLCPGIHQKTGPEQMSLTQRSRRWLAGNHSGCCGGDSAGESDELGVG